MHIPQAHFSGVYKIDLLEEEGATAKRATSNIQPLKPVPQHAVIGTKDGMPPKADGSNIAGPDDKAIGQFLVMDDPQGKDNTDLSPFFANHQEKSTNTGQWEMLA